MHVRVCMFVCLLVMESLSHKCCCSGWSYEWSPFRLMTDTWWPLLWMDIWPLTLSLLPRDLTFCRRMALWRAIFEMSTHREHEMPASTVPLYIYMCVCFSVIMDHLVNNAAEGWQCTTFSHENSFSFCRSLPPTHSTPLLRPSTHKTISFVPIDPVCQY